LSSWAWRGIHSWLTCLSSPSVRREAKLASVRTRYRGTLTCRNGSMPCRMKETARMTEAMYWGAPGRVVPWVHGLHLLVPSTCMCAILASFGMHKRLELSATYWYISYFAPWVLSDSCTWDGCGIWSYIFIEGQHRDQSAHRTSLQISRPQLTAFLERRPSSSVWNHIGRNSTCTS
jgi:hypothetical protein